MLGNFWERSGILPTKLLKLDIQDFSDNIDVIEKYFEIKEQKRIDSSRKNNHNDFINLKARHKKMMMNE